MICNPIFLITFLNDPKFILLCTVKWFYVLLNITNSPTKHQSFVYNDQTSINHLFALNLNVKHFYLTHRKERNQMQPLRVRVDLGAMAMKGYSLFLEVPILQEDHFQIV